MCPKLHRWTSLPCTFSSTAFCVVLVLSGLIQSTSYGQKDHAQPRHWTHWMHGGEVDLEKARQSFDAQPESRLESRSCGVKPFERWTWWMQEHGGLNKAPRPESWWEASEGWRSSRAHSALDSQWTALVIRWPKRCPDSRRSRPDKPLGFGSVGFGPLVCMRTIGRTLAFFGCR